MKQIIMKQLRFLIIFVMTISIFVGITLGISIKTLAYDDNPYADLVNTTKTVKFNNIDWYIIEDNSLATNTGSVTLFAKNPLSFAKFHYTIQKGEYKSSVVKEILDKWTDENGSFADVASAIKSVDLSDVGVKDAKLYLLSKDEVKNLKSVIRKCDKYENFDCYWLRTVGYGPMDNRSGYWAPSGESKHEAVIYCEKGDIYDMQMDIGRYVTDYQAIRPALQLDLSRVKYDEDEREFSLFQHDYNLKYNVDGATITAICCNTDNCPLAYFNYKATLTIEAPTLNTYGGIGNAEVTISDPNNIKGDAVVNYYRVNENGTNKTGELLQKAPTDAGKYWAEITLGNEENNKATAHIVYEIKKANPIAPSSKNAYCGQTLADVELEKGWTWFEPTASVGEEGENIFKANFYENDNYNAALDVDVYINVSKVTPIIIADDNIIKVNKTISLNPITSPKIDVDWRYVSYNTSVATVDKNGIVTGISEGDTEILIFGDVNDKKNYNNPDYKEVKIKVLNKNPQNIVVDDINVTYGESGKKLIVSKEGSGKIRYEVKPGFEEYIDVDGYTGELTIKKVPSIKAYVIVTAEETNGEGPDESGYALATKEVAITIEKANGTITEAPKKKSLSYTGFSQELLVKGVADGGVILYALGNDEENVPQTGWSKSVAVGIDAKKYYVWYKVMGDNNHNDTNAVCVDVDISRANITPTVNISSWIYGQTAILPNVTGNKGNAIVNYSYASKDGEEYNTTIPKVAGEYTVKAVIDQTDNYYGCIVTKDFSILKKAVIVSPNDDQSKVYGADDPAFTATVTGVVEEDKINYTLARDVGENAGTYDINVILGNNPNYDITSTKGTFTINKAEPTYTKPVDKEITCKQTLEDIKLGDGFSFADPNQLLTFGENTVNVKYTPTDTANYNVVENIAIKVTVNNHVLTKTNAVEATCEKAGNNAYYTCSVCGKYFSDAEGKTEIEKDFWVISAKGHNYGEPTYTWSEDGKTCTAKVICKREGCTDSSEGHKVTENAVVSSKVKEDATTEKMGTTTYTATFTNELFETQIKDVADIPKLDNPSDNPVDNPSGETRNKQDISTDKPQDTLKPVETPTTPGVKEEGTTIITTDAKAEVRVISKTDEKPAVTYTKTTDNKAKSVVVSDNVTVDDVTYEVSSVEADSFKGSNATTVTIGKNIKKLAPKAFNGSKIKMVIIKTKKLTKKSVRNAFKGCKEKKIVIKVKVGSKKLNKKYVKKYKKIFTKKNVGLKVVVK